VVEVDLDAAGKIRLLAEGHVNETNSAQARCILFLLL